MTDTDPPDTEPAMETGYHFVSMAEALCGVLWFMPLRKAVIPPARPVSGA
jgi:hypothetical protein